MSILDYIEKIKLENEGPRITAQEPRIRAETGGSMPEHLTRMEPKIDDDFWINHYRQVIDARLGAMEEVRKQGEPVDPDDAEYLFKQYNELKKYGGDTLEFDQRIKNLSPSAEEPEFAAHGGRIGLQGGQLVDHGPERQDYYQGRVVTRKGFPHEGEYALYRKKNRETVTKYFKNKKMADEWAKKNLPGSGRVGTAKVHKYVQSLPDNTVVTKKLIQDFLDKNNLDVNLNNLFNKQRTSYIGDHITNKTVTVDPSYKASVGDTKKYKKTKEILNNPQLKNKLIKFANKPGVSARDVWTKFNISETEWNRGGLRDIISKDFLRESNKLLKPKTVKNMLLLHNHKEAKEFIRKGLIIPDEIIEKLGLKAGEAATATVRLGQHYGGQDFMIKDLNTIRRNNVASDKIFTALNKFKFGNPYRAKLYRTALETIDIQLGNERGTFESLKKAASHILKKNKIKGFDINEIAGVTGSAKSKAVEFSQFIDIMDRNLNQKTLANFQGQLSIARQNIEKNPNVLSSESKRINKLARNLEDAHDIKLPRLRDPDAAKYFSPKRLKELEAQGLDIVKAAERAGYTIEMPKGAITVKEFVGEGKNWSKAVNNSKAKMLAKALESAGVTDICSDQLVASGGRIGFAKKVCGTKFAEQNPDGFMKKAADHKEAAKLFKSGNMAKHLMKAKNWAKSNMGPAGWIGGELLIMGLGSVWDMSQGKGWKEALDNWTGLGGHFGQAEKRLKEIGIEQGYSEQEINDVMKIGQLMDLSTEAEGKQLKLDQIQEQQDIGGTARVKYNPKFPGAYKPTQGQYQDPKDVRNLKTEVPKLWEEGTELYESLKDFDFSAGLYDKLQQEKAKEEYEKKMKLRNMPRHFAQQFGIGAAPEFEPWTPEYAGGGMVGIRKPDAIPPERQGLRSIMINGKKS